MSILCNHACFFISQLRLNNHALPLTWIFHENFINAASISFVIKALQKGTAADLSAFLMKAAGT